MTIQRILLVFFLCGSMQSFAQEFTPQLDTYSDSSSYRLVIRVEENTGERQVTLDNMTIKVYNDTTKVYYMHYGDGLISSLTIPYVMTKRFQEFEVWAIENACTRESCTYSILFEMGANQVRIPVDVLHIEAVSSLMFELEL